MKAYIYYLSAVILAAFAAHVLLSGAVAPALLLAAVALWTLILPAAGRDLAKAAAREAPQRRHLSQWGWSQSSDGLWVRGPRLVYRGVTLPAASANSLADAYSRQRSEEALIDAAQDAAVIGRQPSASGAAAGSASVGASSG